MNALIIGGSGGLSSVVAKLAMKKYRVWALTRGNREVPDGVISVVADRNDHEAVRQVLAAQNVRWDVVFDCICMNREHAEADLEILPEFTDRLIVVSTDSVYDGRFKQIPENEEGICVDEPGSSDECTYAGNKRHMEEVFLRDMRTRKSGLKITIFRPGHIYGPGFLLGCFPEHSRQKELPELILKGAPIRLVGMGTYIIHPIYVDDLAEALVDCAGNEKTYGEIFCIGGPRAVENRTYYETIAKCLGTEVTIEEVPLSGYLEKHPEYSGHLCHRVYDLTKLKAAGVRMPSVGLTAGIARSLRSLGCEVDDIYKTGRELLPPEKVEYLLEFRSASYHNIVNRTLSEYTREEWYACIHEGILPEHCLPRFFETLDNDPLAPGAFHRGELLYYVTQTDKAFWTAHKDWYEFFLKITRRALETIEENKGMDSSFTLPQEYLESYKKFNGA